MKSAPPTTTRDHLVRALHADLVGPFLPEDIPAEEAYGQDGDEILPFSPSRWYLTGFLAPHKGRLPEAQVDEGELEAGDDRADLDGTNPEPSPKQRHQFPASCGLTVLLDDGEGSLYAHLSWAEYSAQSETDADGRHQTRWRRREQPTAHQEVPLDPEVLSRGFELSAAPGVWLQGKLETIDLTGDDPLRLPVGTRALTLFVVNRRRLAPRGRREESFLFQVRLELTREDGFLARPNTLGEHSQDWDDRILDLQYREHCEYVVGHGVSAEVVERTSSGLARSVATSWIPTAEVPLVRTRSLQQVTTSMGTLADLAALAEGDALRAALTGLPAAYGDWIENQAATDLGSDDRRSTLKVMVQRARQCRERMVEGIELLATDPQARDAFHLANKAMALVRRNKEDDPQWRLFQLGFILLSLPSITKADHKDRKLVELIFFPTGGGKTEAYLGVIAYTLVLRRLRGAERPDRGLGTAVLLRYTLRLLTLDQLGRAASLVCALEVLRAQRQDLGAVRFAIGLWVGRSATANTLTEVAAKVSDYRNGRTSLSPVPLTACPWCGHELDKQVFHLVPSASKPEELVVGCAKAGCEFSLGRRRSGLPVLFVDEQIYRELPAFLIATVDKFAMLPWRGETGMLFGRVAARAAPGKTLGKTPGKTSDTCRFYGPLDAVPQNAVPQDAKPLPEGLPRPELIVQDELHLISGPLGTMVGLYEATVEALCRQADGTLPKILASTATVRRAAAQTQNLFDRRVRLFPPPGVDASETFFAEVDHEAPGRLYVGVAPPGRAMKALLLRVYTSLLAAAVHCHDGQLPPEQEADGYTTLAGYFNSLRELGGMRRLVEDEVRTRVEKADMRRPVNWALRQNPWFTGRQIQPEPVELTSREPTTRITEVKARLGLHHGQKKAVDVVLASNMISVGVDIDRLGLMVIAGQPKTTSEYIQASSRVGRRPWCWPGLVVTCLNHYKARDRSHYERFATFHESFYRFVEPTSLTPFSTPALDRGLAANLVAMTRLLDPAMTPVVGAMRIAEHRSLAEEAAEHLATRATHGIEEKEEQERLREYIVQRCRNLLDAWEEVIRRHTGEDGGGGQRTYSKYDRERRESTLLYTATEDPPVDLDLAKFRAPTSMRDVEPSVHLWLDRRRV